MKKPAKAQLIDNIQNPAESKMSIDSEGEDPSTS